MAQITNYENMLTYIINNLHKLNPGSDTFKDLNFINYELLNETHLKSTGDIRLGQFGEIIIPFFSMGNISSLNLFGLNEIIIFAWYLKNRESYCTFGDLGANIGLHSIIASKLGWKVKCFEPDELIISQLKSNLNKNRCSEIEILHTAISNRDGKSIFVRVKNNLTGSHLYGSKQPYGPVEKFEVKTTNFRSIIQNFDLIKMDVEGSEGSIIEVTDHDDWTNTDCILEIGSHENQIRIFDHLQKINVPIYSQKNGWKRCTTADLLPKHHSEGSAFISSKRGFL